MTKELIIAITQHRKFGSIFSAYIITPSEGNTFYTSIEKANNINIQEIDNISYDKEQIVKFINEYDDNYIANLFTKKKEDARNFIKNVDYEFINLRIRPHIEKRIHQIARLLVKSNLRLFFKDRKYSKIYMADRITFANANADAIFNFNRTDQGIQYFLSISQNQEEILLKNKKAFILADSPCVLLLQQQLYIFKDIDSKKLQPFFEKDYISIARQTEKVYFEKFVLNAIKQYRVKAQGFKISVETVNPKLILYLQNDLQGRPTLLLKFQYGAKLIFPNNTEWNFVTLAEDNDRYEFHKIQRNKHLESDLLEQLKQIGLSSSDGVHFYSPVSAEIPLDAQLFETINWLNNKTEQFNKLEITIKQSFFDKIYNLNAISLKISVSEENDWFDIRGKIQLGEFSIPFIRLRRNILKNIREFELPDGSIAILPLEWFTKYKEIFMLADYNAESLKMNKFHFNLISSDTIGFRSDYAERIKDLFNQKLNENAELPEGLQATLRPYQVQGFQWMTHLKYHKFGGCLADDMGLGKTLQTLTLLLESSTEKVNMPFFKDKHNKTQLSLFDVPAEPVNCKIKPTSLIIMPASLIHNWFNELLKFTPNLKVFKHVGNNRLKDLSEFTAYDIVLTTYGVIRNDVDELKHFLFHYLILDESQVIKNPDSKIYKSVIQLQSTYKLVLTGTPIENSLTDLWSQMNFVNKGLLGSYNFFKKEFVSPIEKYQSKSKSEKLKALIHPFILRRTKDQVAKDLPSRTEQISYCDMSELQRKIYEEEKSAVRNNILENMEKFGAAKSSFLVLQALTRLRQLANHPQLIDKEEESGKFEEVTRMLMNIVSENHKVLIFSSFVQHLNLYAKFLDEKHMKYSLLTGKTQNRQQVIEDFQNDTENQVFLISLKAGGVGLNLTAADYVFLLDPWWNPAAENQAINRAHRIGQDKKVFVYRFISSDSIEEKIVQLQERKSELADLFINTNNPFKALTPDRVQELFE
jgi:SNF2 family DNA or RNA helicase